MTVDELFAQLKELLSHAPERGTTEVRILVQRSSPPIGARHTIGVRDVGCGIDWEHGMFLVTPDQPAYVGLDSLKAAARFARRIREIMHWHQSSDDTRQRNANAISAIEEALDKWISSQTKKLQTEQGKG